MLHMVKNLQEASERRRFSSRGKTGSRDRQYSIFASLKRILLLVMARTGLGSITFPSVVLEVG